MFSHFRRQLSKLPQATLTQPTHKNFSSLSSLEFAGNNRERANIFAPNKNGMLSRVLSIFHHNNITCTDVTTKVLNVDKTGRQEVLFGIDFEGKAEDARVNKALQELSVFSRVQLNQNAPEVPWFPTSFQDLDSMGIILQAPDEDAAKDHPGFKDPEYKRRRDLIAKNTDGYKMGNPIPGMKYTDLENKTWETIFSRLRPLQEKYMCDSFNKNFEKMLSAGVMRPDRVPQLQDLNEYLTKETNFRLKPVTGILSQREFFNALAMRTFCCTQYIRHHSVPEYTPEPDIIHELIGHVAMFADSDFCDLSHEFGLLSVGNTQESLSKLGALYWYTVEFGVCKEGNGVKGYGAGIASSIGEIKNFGEGNPEFRPLNPFVELKMDFPIQTVQPMYYVAESFKDACQQLIRYGEFMPRPFKAYFNHATNRVEVDRKIKLVKSDE